MNNSPFLLFVLAFVLLVVGSIYVSASRIANYVVTTIEMQEHMEQSTQATSTAQNA